MIPDPGALLAEVTKRVSLRVTHPNLYLALMTTSVMSVALALNFFVSHPTFSPYEIPKNLIGVVFLALGASQIIFLNLYHNLKLVRFVTAASFSFMLFWGLSNTQQSFAGKASFQLPILYLALAAIQFPLLREPPVNPLTANGKKLNGKT